MTTARGWASVAVAGLLLGGGVEARAQIPAPNRPTSNGVFGGSRGAADPERPSVNLQPAATPQLPVYLTLGITHLLEGFDHILFVVALVILIQNRRRRLAAITAFTAAHSVTLALSTFDLLLVPQASVEAIIALSILFVAVELTRPVEARSITATSSASAARSACFRAHKSA